MKRIIHKIYALLLIIIITSCVGYEPIFVSERINFEIVKHSINGDKILGNKIYSKLSGLSYSKKENNENTRKIDLNIKTNKTKNATSKDSTGKVLEYQIRVDVEVILKDYFTNKIILNKNIGLSSKYKIQEQYSRTIDLENQTTENLINNISQSLIISISTELTK